MSEQLKHKTDHKTPARRGGKRLASARAEQRQTASVRQAASVRQTASVREAAKAAAVKPLIPEWEEEAAPSKAGPEKKPRRTLRERVRDWRDSEGEISPAVTLWQGAKEKARTLRRNWRRLAREKRNRRFPESDRLPVQALLLAWGLLPMLGGLRRERTHTRRRQRQDRTMALQTKLSRWKIHPAVCLGVGGAAAVLGLFFSIYTFGTTVRYDGEVVAAVNSQSAAEEAAADLEAVTARTLGQTYTIDDELIQYSSGLMRRQDLVDETTLEEDLSRQIGLVTQAYSLYVDGELIGATPYEGALEELLGQLQSTAADENTISCEFAEDVEIRYEYVPTEKLMNLGYLAETLYSTKTAEATYTVKAGDTWSEIAEDHGMTSKELLELNPGYNIDRIQIGEVLTLSEAVPYLTVTVKQREYYVEDVMYDVEYTDSAYLYKGDYEVTSPGEYGAADVVANVTYVNGVETERTVLSSVLLKEPVTEQRLQGTKERPTWLPTGTFRWPISGRITSTFGGRSSPGGIGSTNHKGIDIAGSYGIPVYASDGGTVSYAGWMGGYGYLVEIDHGNGYVTRYGHNSSLTVSVGEHVYKGQQIARVGSTGNSTGNHCHFEIRYNGVAKNPLNYLP